MNQILIIIREDNNNIVFDVRLIDSLKNETKVVADSTFFMKTYDIENFENNQFFISQSNVLAHKINEFIDTHNYTKSKMILCLDSFCFLEKINLPKSALKNTSNNIDQEMINNYKINYDKKYVLSKSISPILDNNMYQATILMIRRNIYQRLLYISSLIKGKLVEVEYYSDVVLSHLLSEKKMDKTSNFLAVFVDQSGFSHVLSYIDRSLASSSYYHLNNEEIKTWESSIAGALEESASAKRFKDKKVVPLKVSKGFYDLFLPIIKEIEKNCAFFYNYEIPTLFLNALSIDTEFFDLCFEKKFPEIKVERTSMDISSLLIKKTKTFFTLPLKVKNVK